MTGLQQALFNNPKGIVVKTGNNDVLWVWDYQNNCAARKDAMTEIERHNSTRAWHNIIKDWGFGRTTNRMKFSHV
jgi:hypothetical protein